VDVPLEQDGHARGRRSGSKRQNCSDLAKVGTPKCSVKVFFS
jgi:hypothetical protein